MIMLYNQVIQRYILIISIAVLDSGVDVSGANSIPIKKSWMILKTTAPSSFSTMAFVCDIARGKS